MPTAILDSNEATGTPVLEEVLNEHNEIDDVAIEALPVGDIAFRGCLFERKSVDDFASSMTDEDDHLLDQIERLDEHDAETFLLVEGDMRTFENTWANVSADAMRGMVASLTVRADTKIKFCSTMQSLVDLLARMARKADSDVDEIEASAPSRASGASFMVNCFMGVDGIGKETAEDLANEFGTISELAESEADDFESINGVGPTLSERLIENI